MSVLRDLKTESGTAAFYSASFYESTITSYQRGLRILVGIHDDDVSNQAPGTYLYQHFDYKHSENGNTRKLSAPCTVGDTGEMTRDTSYRRITNASCYLFADSNAQVLEFLEADDKRDNLQLNNSGTLQINRPSDIEPVCLYYYGSWFCGVGSVLYNPRDITDNYIRHDVAMNRPVKLKELPNGVSL